jgi:hypothetical protein
VVALNLVPVRGLDGLKAWRIFPLLRSHSVRAKSSNPPFAKHATPNSSEGFLNVAAVSALQGTAPAQRGVTPQQVAQAAIPYYNLNSKE